MPKVLLDSNTLRSLGGVRGSRDWEQIRWSERWKRKKILEASSRLCERLLNCWAAQLRSWTRHKQDSEKNAKWSSKDGCSAFLYIFPILISSFVCLSVSVHFWACTLFLFFISLHVTGPLSCCRPHEFSPTYSILYLRFFSSSFLPLSIFLLPSPTEQKLTQYSSSWVVCRRQGYLCVCVSICQSVYICYHMCLFAHWVSNDRTDSFVFLARPCRVWQWTKCQCVRMDQRPAQSVIACPRSDTWEPVAWDSS